MRQSLSVVARRQRWQRIEFGTSSGQRPEYEAEGVCQTSTAGSSPALAANIFEFDSAPRGGYRPPSTADESVRDPIGCRQNSIERISAP